MAIDKLFIGAAVKNFMRPQPEADGGKGSGNFGHAGRVGQVGGSAPEGEGGGAAGSAEAKKTSLPESKTIGGLDKKKFGAIITKHYDELIALGKERKYKGSSGYEVGKMASEALKNDWLDLPLTKSGTRSTGIEELAVAALDAEERRQMRTPELVKKLESQKQKIMAADKATKSSFLSEYGFGAGGWDTASDSDVDSGVEQLFEILKNNGDMTPQKERTGMGMDDGGSRRTSSDMLAYAAKELGKDAVDEDVERYVTAVREYTDEEWWMADRKSVAEYVRNARAYDGEIYRGLHLDDAGYEKFIEKIEVGGTMMSNVVNSWTSDFKKAERYSLGHTNPVALESALNESGNLHKHQVVVICHKNLTSAPIAYMSYSSGEMEVISDSRAVWTVTGIANKEGYGGGQRHEIHVIERGV